MALTESKNPEEGPPRATGNPRVRVGPITRQLQVDTEYEPDRYTAYGIQAACELWIDVGERGSFVITQRITTPGVWGVEVEDPDTDEYVATLYSQECELLLSMLRVLGIEPASPEPAAEVPS